MKKKHLLLAATLAVAVGISAQNKSAGINLSLWKKTATQPLDSLQTTYVNLGFQSTMNRLNGVGLNLLASVVQKDINGAQVSGLANISGGSMRGIQLSGISNINGNNVAGLSAAGLVNVSGNNVRGVLLSGMTNITGDHTHGVVLSGLMNISGNQGTGVQIAGLANIAGSIFRGVSAAGFLNVVGETIDGVQLSALGNVAGKQMNGAQIGLVNIATRAKGVQLGVVNYYREEMKGLQLGLVNANPDTRIQMMLFGGNATKINVGARFKNELFYTIVGGGTHYLEFGDEFSAAVFYRAGLWLPLCKDLTISGDLGYQHIETFENRDYGIPARLYGLQARVNLEYQLTKKFGIFATGGYGGSRYYHRNKTFDKGVIVEAGIVLF